jgi:hypothetical protein
MALFRRPLGFDRRRPVVERRVVLIVLAADEAVEMFEAGACRPVMERADRRGLEHRHFMALPELRRRIAVQLEDFCERCTRVRAHRVVAWRRRRDLGDAAHADRVVVAAREHGRAGRRAERRGVEAVVLQAACGEPFGGRCVTGPAKRARGAKADVIEQDDEHVRCASRRTQRADRRKFRVRILCVAGRQAGGLAVRNRQHFTREVIVARHLILRFWPGCEGGSPDVPRYLLAIATGSWCQCRLSMFFYYSFREVLCRDVCGRARDAQSPASPSRTVHLQRRIENLGSSLD